MKGNSRFIRITWNTSGILFDPWEAPMFDPGSGSFLGKTEVEILGSFWLNSGYLSKSLHLQLDEIDYCRSLQHLSPRFVDFFLGGVGVKKRDSCFFLWCLFGSFDWLGWVGLGWLGWLYEFCVFWCLLLVDSHETR